MSVQPAPGAFFNPLRENVPSMYRPYTCAEAALRQRQQSLEFAQPVAPCLPANVAQGVNVDVIVFCDGTPQMKCTAKLGSKAFTHSVSTYYLYQVPPMLRKQLRKLQQCRWGYGFEVVKDPVNGEVKVVHLTYSTKPFHGNKDEPATLRLTTYTNPDDGASAVVEYARDFKANRKRKLSLPANSKAMPSGTRMRLSGGTLQYSEHDYSSPIQSQSGSPTSPYFTRSPSASSDCTRATDRLALSGMPIPNTSGSNHAPCLPDGGWDIKEEPMMANPSRDNGSFVQTSSAMHSSSVMHTSSGTDPNDTSRGNGSGNVSAQPTPTSLAQYDDGYTSQASSHTTPAPSPLLANNQHPVQIQATRPDANRYMPAPQRGQGHLGGGHHRLFGGHYEHLSSNSSNTMLNLDTNGSPGSGECSEDDVDPGMYCNGSYGNSNFGHQSNMQGCGKSIARGGSTKFTIGGMPGNSNTAVTLGGGARKLSAGSNVFNFKPQMNKAYDPDATVHSMYLPKDPTMPSCASRLPNIRPVHVPSNLTLSHGQTSLEDWQTQAAASATPTPNSSMAMPGQLPNLFDDNFARSQCAAGALPSFGDLDWTRLPMPSPGAPLSASHFNMWGDDSFGSDCGVRNDNFQTNMDLDSLLNTSSWGQAGSAAL